MGLVYILAVLLIVSGLGDTRHLTSNRQFINLIPVRARSENSQKISNPCDNGRCLFSSYGWGGGYDGYGYQDPYSYGYEPTYYDPYHVDMEYCQQLYDPYTGEVWEDCVPY